MEVTNPNSPWFPHVWVDADRMNGEPCFRGTRLPVRLLFEYLMNGRTVEEFIGAFEGVPRDKVMGVLQVAEREVLRGAKAA
ncbi:MAG: DUF433 domain-containing protein [Phycisphaerales bacterium]